MASKNDGPDVTSLLQALGKAVYGTRGRAETVDSPAWWEHVLDDLASALSDDDTDTATEDGSGSWTRQDNRRIALHTAVRAAADYEFEEVNSYEELARVLAGMAAVFESYLSGESAPAVNAAAFDARTESSE